MDLWIRSQDKEMLVKCKCIEIMWQDGIPNLYVNGQFPDYIVANYQTRERALEVLDVIQKLIMDGNRLIFKTNTILKDRELEHLDKSIKSGKCFAMNKDIQVENVGLDTIVYQMPLE